MRGIICQVATPRYFEGHGRVGHHLASYFSGHGHRLKCGRCFNCNGFEYMSYTGGFDPVAGFPPVGLLLAIRS